MGVLAILALAATVATGSSVGLNPSAAADRTDRATRTVSVRLHDYANLADDDLLAAEDQVSEIYARIGVVLDWRVPVHPDRFRAGMGEWPSDPAAALSVLILTSPMAHGIGIRDDVAGYAAVSADEGGSVAFVVADRTRRIAESAQLTHTRVVSSVIAHELAHLLMPNQPHSQDGIMRAHWHPGDFRFLLNRVFSRSEGEIIRREVARLSRTVHQADN